MRTYDRVSQIIFEDKRKIDIAIKQNEELRNKCISALAEAKEFFDKALKDSK